MKVLIFGATGMVGQGVLRACIDDSGVTALTAVGRSPTGMAHPKFTEILRPDVADLGPVSTRLAGFDACFFCLGVSSVGISEAEYKRVTYDLTLSVANSLAKLNPKMTFVYVSGMGTDGTGRGRVMWARVKGKTENDLLNVPFAACYSFRPGLIVPVKGVVLRTAAYKTFYSLVKPVLPLLRRLFPNQILTTDEIGRAMLAVARRGYPTPILEARDIRACLRR